MPKEQSGLVSDSKEPDRSARIAAKLQFWSLIAWPTITFVCAKLDPNDWGGGYGIVLGAVVALAGSAFAAAIGVRAIRHGTKLKVRAALPIPVSLGLLGFLLVLFG